MIANAPYIREAEMYGMPPYDEPPEPVCPICGKECETIYMNKDKDVFGCDVCIRIQDAWEWAEEKNEEE